ncbi:hypothetical protein BGW42_005451 [Actinomortierella wolfii]|nr:hypothetical protein BGW42_005451 [Actinomortierella wolfii]
MTTTSGPNLSTAAGTPTNPAQIRTPIDNLLPTLKFYRKTTTKLYEEYKKVAIQLGANNAGVVKVYNELYSLTLRLSTSGWALLLGLSESSKIASIRTQLSQLKASQVPAAGASSVPSLASSASSIRTTTTTYTATTTTTDISGMGPDLDEKAEELEVNEMQKKLKKHRSSAEKLFREYKIKPTDLEKFVLPRESLQCDMSDPRNLIAEDDFSKTYGGRIVKGGKVVDVVHVKQLTEIEGGSTEDIIRRTIFLTHLLRACENVVRPKYVVMPNLILLEPTSRRTLYEFTLPHWQKVDVAHKIASALALLHSFNIVHRDVRGANVIISEATLPNGLVVQIPKLTGFEVCRHINYDYSLGSVVKRTVWHAPERVSWHGTSFKTDVFSFGVLMYEISMGKPPEMKGYSVAHSDVQDWISQEYDHISQDYSTLMAKCLEIDYPNRPEMKSVVEELQNIAVKIPMQFGDHSGENN